jgi:hypothetical protein
MLRQQLPLNFARYGHLIHASFFGFTTGDHRSRRAQTQRRNMRRNRSQCGGLLPGAGFCRATSTENRGATAKTRITLGLRCREIVFEHDERLNRRRAGLPVTQDLGPGAGSFWNIVGFGDGHVVPCCSLSEVRRLFRRVLLYRSNLAGADCGRHSKFVEHPPGAKP